MGNKQNGRSNKFAKPSEVSPRSKSAEPAFHTASSQIEQQKEQHHQFSTSNAENNENFDRNNSNNNNIQLNSNNNGIDHPFDSNNQYVTTSFQSRSSQKAEQELDKNGKKIKTTTTKTAAGTAVTPPPRMHTSQSHIQVSKLNTSITGLNPKSPITARSNITQQELISEQKHQARYELSEHVSRLRQTSPNHLMPLKSEISLKLSTLKAKEQRNAKSKNVTASKIGEITNSVEFITDYFHSLSQYKIDAQLPLPSNLLLNSRAYEQLQQVRNESMVLIQQLASSAAAAPRHLQSVQEELATIESTIKEQQKLYDRSSQIIGFFDHVKKAEHLTATHGNGDATLLLNYAHFATPPPSVLNSIADQTPVINQQQYIHPYIIEQQTQQFNDNDNQTELSHQNQGKYFFGEYNNQPPTTYFHSNNTNNNFNNNNYNNNSFQNNNNNKHKPNENHLITVLSPILEQRQSQESQQNLQSQLRQSEVYPLPFPGADTESNAIPFVQEPDQPRKPSKIIQLNKKPTTASKQATTQGHQPFQQLSNSVYRPILSSVLYPTEQTPIGQSIPQQQYFNHQNTNNNNQQYLPSQILPEQKWRQPHNCSNISSSETTPPRQKQFHQIESTYSKDNLPYYLNKQFRSYSSNARWIQDRTQQQQIPARTVNEAQNLHTNQSLQTSIQDIKQSVSLYKTSNDILMKSTISHQHTRSRRNSEDSQAQFESNPSQAQYISLNKNINQNNQSMNQSSFSTTTMVPVPFHARSSATKQTTQNIEINPVFEKILLSSQKNEKQQAQTTNAQHIQQFRQWNNGSVSDRPYIQKQEQTPKKGRISPQKSNLKPSKNINNSLQSAIEPITDSKRSTPAKKLEKNLQNHSQHSPSTASAGFLQSPSNSNFEHYNRQFSTQRQQQPRNSTSQDQRQLSSQRQQFKQQQQYEQHQKKQQPFQQQQHNYHQYNNSSIPDSFNNYSAGGGDDSESQNDSYYLQYPNQQLSSHSQGANRLVHFVPSSAK